MVVYVRVHDIMHMLCMTMFCVLILWVMTALLCVCVCAFERGRVYEDMQRDIAMLNLQQVMAETTEASNMIIYYSKYN